MFYQIKNVSFEFDDGEIEITIGHEVIDHRYIGKDTSKEEFTHWCDYYIKTEEFSKKVSGKNKEIV